MSSVLSRGQRKTVILLILALQHHIFSVNHFQTDCKKTYEKGLWNNYLKHWTFILGTLVCVQTVLKAYLGRQCEYKISTYKAEIEGYSGIMAVYITIYSIDLYWLVTGVCILQKNKEVVAQISKVLDVINQQVGSDLIQ